MDLTINKIAAGVVGLAMVAGLALAFTATRAHAITLSELVELFIALEVIPADKADEARTVLTGQGEGTSPATAMSCSFTRNLTTGDTGQDVMDLQKLLNVKGFTLAATGAGSPGQETSYFGPATAGAVAKMQEAYASEILTPLGLTAGTGYFGASTRAKANALCAAAPVTPPTPDDEDEEDTDDADLSGEASLKSFDIASGDDDQLEEGDEEVVVAEGTVEFEDGDAMITRVDVSFVADGANDEMDPWDVFDTVSLWVDGDMVAEKAADDEDNYLNENDGSIRFSGLDIVAMEDEEVDIQVAVTLMNNLDGVNNDEVWNVAIDGLRYVDADDYASSLDDSDDADFGSTVDFTINEAGFKDEIIVKSSTSDPDSSIIKVDTDAKSDFVTVFAFDIDTDDSINDIEIETVDVNLTLGYGYSTVVDDAELVIDGTTIDSFDVSSTTGTTTVLTFDVDKDVAIDAGDRVKAELKLRFRALANEGTTVQADIDSAAITGEGVDDVTSTGSATGEVHQLMSTGIFAEIVSTSVDTMSNGVDDDSVGKFTIKFDVTAFEDTYYVSTTTAVFDFDLLDGDGAAAAGTSSASISSTATKKDGAYRIDEGDTETFTLTINLEPGVAGYYRAILNSVDFGTAPASPTDMDAHTCAPADDFETDPIYVNA